MPALRKSKRHENAIIRLKYRSLTKDKCMNKSKSKLVLATIIIFLSGCSMQPTIQKVNESKSGFDSALLYKGESFILNKDESNNEQYRIYEKGATGFVSLDALEIDAKQRANDFCSEQNKGIKTLKIQRSSPPHILGNFPRVEITFICVDKPNATAPSTDDALYTKLNNLKKLLDNGTITKEEFEKEKAKILNQ
jgi:hypothetical protein